MSWIQFIHFVEKKSANAPHQVANLDLEANDERVKSLSIVHLIMLRPTSVSTRLQEMVGEKTRWGYFSTNQSFLKVASPPEVVGKTD